MAEIIPFLSFLTYCASRLQATCYINQRISKGDWSRSKDSLYTKETSLSLSPPFHVSFAPFKWYDETVDINSKFNLFLFLLFNEI